jgi:MoxR-like ATPase
MEAMEEHAVTSGGKQRPLPSPFLVLATQNPIEQEGTYELPAAQLDRFLLRIEVDYPDAEDERRIVRRTTSGRPASLPQVLSKHEILALQALVRETPCPEPVARYATQLARATRPGEDAPKSLETLVQWGAGPRAAQSLVITAKARALLQARREPTAEDVRAVLPAVMRHRLIPSYAAAAENVSVDEIVQRVRDAVPAPDGWRPAPPVVEAKGLFAKLRRRGTKTAG